MQRFDKVYSMMRMPAQRGPFRRRRDPARLVNSYHQIEIWRSGEPHSREIVENHAFFVDIL